MQVLMNILATRGVLEQGASLDALISIMLDSSINQMVCFLLICNQTTNKWSSGGFKTLIPINILI